MKIMVFGQSGQVAQELTQFDGVVSLSRQDADFEDAQACAEIVAETDAHAIIIAAAYTQVDQAESEEELATQVNAVTPTAIAEEAAKRQIPVVYISTDYVFEGAGETAWSPIDETLPQNAYGRSKRQGEEGIIKAGGPFAILRTSWVFSAHGHNFVKTMLRLGAERDELTIINDQIGGPTSARDIAKTCYNMAIQLTKDPSKSGVYHYSGAPDTSWAGFAQEIFDQAGLSCKISPIETSAYPTPAKRPLNSRLDCSLTEEVFAIGQPNWKSSLSDVLTELGVSNSE